MSVVYNCCWPSPTQSTSGPSPARHVTLFYSLRFETLPSCRTMSRYLYPPVIPQALVSLFVASYDSQGYGGGIRTRLHTTCILSVTTCSYFLDSDGIEITASSNSLVACVFIVAGTCLPSRCLPNASLLVPLFRLVKGERLHRQTERSSHNPPFIFPT
jgi:hypothetical protein